MEPDYGQAALPTQNTAASNVAPALPDTVPAGNNGASADVPSTNAEATPAELAPVAVSKDLIRIKTDVPTWLSTRSAVISSS